MRKNILIALAIVGTIVAAAAQGAKSPDAAWTSRFDLDAADLVSTGRNPYFILEPGYTLTLQDGKERLVVTVLNETRRVDGVETRIVEERETNGTDLVEVSRNYFAISTRTNAVFYFGEDVDTYKNGTIDNHEGAWLAGVNGAKAGLMMPGLALMSAKYYEEVAPNIAMDRGEIVSVDDVLRTPAGEFKNVLKIAETTPLEKGAREYKYFAKDVGLLKDGSLALVKYGRANPTK